MKKIAICGAGRIGKFHLQNLLTIRGCGLAGIFDTDPGELDKVSRDFSVRKYRSWDELIEDRSLDGVVVATPTSSHRQYCCSALSAGKHVFLENC